MLIKKAAMFGLCRVLKKQSWRLFLTSSQSVGSKEARVEHQFKRAAMFGLDARIALAIFGALSVISGAALYSAIQNAKVIAIITDLSELHKAYEQYYLDTGKELPVEVSNQHTIKDLIDNVDNVTGWQGPYLAYRSLSDQELIYPKYNIVKFYVRSINDAWGGTDGVDAVTPNTCSGSAEPCGVWSAMAKMPLSLASAVDEYVDGSADFKNGKLRVYCDSSGCYVYLLGMPTNSI